MLNTHLFVPQVSGNLRGAICLGTPICSCFISPLILLMWKLKSKVIPELVESVEEYVSLSLLMLRTYLCQASLLKPLVPFAASQRVPLHNVRCSPRPPRGGHFPADSLALGMMN